jgi:hypothetical protein
LARFLERDLFDPGARFVDKFQKAGGMIHAER